LLLLCILLGALAACTQSTAETAPTVTPLPTHTSPAPTPSPTATAPTSTPTPALVPTQTRTSTATKTPPPTPRPLPPTPTVTPYPTFDLAQVTPRVPQPTAICPIEDPNLEVVVDRSSITDLRTFVDAIWQLIDNGASIQQVAAAFDEAYQMESSLPLIDLTGDGLPELVVSHTYETIGIGCDNGEYKALFSYSTVDAFSGGELVSLEDMNLNGIPDVVFAYRATSAGNAVVDVLEWDGAQFVSLIQANHGENSPDTSVLARTLYWYDRSWYWRSRGLVGNVPVMNNYANIETRDLDGNGTLELILTDPGPGHPDTLHNFGPWRGKQVVFTWDGVHYLYSSLEMDPPIYRFQAVQDADRYFLLGNYDRALALYQEAIFSDRLAWWSMELRDYINAVRYADAAGTPRPTPISPDPNEYADLVAYSRYRIMLLHITRGQMESAQIVYDTLQQEFPAEAAGYEYAHIAMLFWTSFEETGSLSLSCASVTAYVEANPDMLFFLGDSAVEHGLQSHIYTAEDICPFK